MPVDFLTDEQAGRYGRYAGAPSPVQLDWYFHLDARDHAFVDGCRGSHNRLGAAVQLGTVRFLGTFLADPGDVPTEVAAYVGTQVGELPELLEQYRFGETRWDHAARIRQAYGYGDFRGRERFRLVRWLYARTWATPDRLTVLFDLATARLVERRVILPGVTVLTKLIARVADRASTRAWRSLAAAVDEPHRLRLEALLQIPDGERRSRLDRLRWTPTRLTAPALVGALKRLVEVRALAVDIPSGVPARRVQMLSRYAATARAQDIADLSADRRTATLAAFAMTAQARALDNVLDLVVLIVGSLFSRVARRGMAGRQRTLSSLDVAARRLREACLVLLDPAIDDLDLRSAVFARVSMEQLVAAAEVCEQLTQAPQDRFYVDILSRYGYVRQFLPALLASVDFGATGNGQHVLDGLAILRGAENGLPIERDDVPGALIANPWQRLVFPGPRTVDRRALTFCVLERLREALRNREVFVSPSERWGDPRAQLLSGDAWEQARPTVCRTLDHWAQPTAELARLTDDLDTAYRRTAERLPENVDVRIDTTVAGSSLVIGSLDRVADAPTLTELRTRIAGLMPRVDLPEVLLEVAGWTGFTDEFTHVTDARSRVDNLRTSVCAVLLAEACNIGLEPLVHAEIPAVTRSRLAWTAHNYVRAETIAAANACLVNYHATSDLARIWGGGEVASADGMRFVVPVRTLNAGPNPKYFGVGRGVTYYNFTSDQFTGFHGIVIPGTIRDSFYILDGLLEQDTDLRPRELMTDTAGYSDVVFGLFWLLGYQFSPRLADAGDARLWRIDPTASYGALDGLGRNRINTAVITEHWDDALRVAGSLAMGEVRASELVRALHTSRGHPSGLARAIAELGRVSKTLYMLAYLDDETYRRRILIQLNRGEARHSLSRAVFHGQRGELRQRYREGQEDQLGALGLVVNAIIAWNTRYLGLAVEHLRTTGAEVLDSDLARMSPMGHEHINLLGRYEFTLPERPRNGQLRELTVPAAAVR